MHLQNCILLATYLWSSVTNCLPKSCDAIDPFKDNNKLETLLQKFDTIVCQKGCKPTVSQFKDWGKEALFDPLLSSTMGKMGLPNVPKITSGISTDVTNDLIDNCAGSMRDQDVCQGSNLDAIGQCLKENMVSVAMNKVEPYSFIVTEDMCKKAKVYLEGEELWEQLIPQYFDKYASKCKDL
ncbi:hypothetical protein EYZ11_007414 [Aspergillus tanneri]|uniref:Uncharacterized protein n=1 Tax=Aspergillus tanneri TaxID=1220188 RepID=A0A4S3JDE7_9EURO|nr:uncharacterized protein ATNIH1004_009303 [Aspergillus tanneri]KAA8645090.1 hypothetical protein ATNIH1004_009303 [Aspergillus tanneri]THC93102.1 hypothetical protein EYZ11_007414 [Aspergillus tanneri]